MPADLDRWITLLVVRPLLRATGSRTVAVPVLMYHSISADSESGIAGYYRVCTGPDLFLRQMEWLHRNGYQGVTLQKGLEALAQQRAGAKMVVITFDDGFRDFHTAAVPVLERFGFSATMYLPTAFIAQQRRSFKGRECLTWEEVLELRARGIQFGSHTVTHPKLHELAAHELEGELIDSRKQIEDRLQTTIESFAHPYAFPQEDGAYVNRLQGSLQKAGYRNCATTIVGRVRAGDDRYTLKRLPVNSGDDEALLEAKMAGAYDWLSGLQSTVRRVKAFRRGGRSRLQLVKGQEAMETNRG